MAVEAWTTNPKRPIERLALPHHHATLKPETTALGDISCEKGREPKAVITHTLPDATADRCDLIVMGMLIEELTVPRLVGIARMSFGLHVLPSRGHRTHVFRPSCT